MFLIAAPIVFGYLFGGLGAGIYLLFRYMNMVRNGETRRSWSLINGIGWSMFVGSFVVGLVIAPHLHESHRPYYPTTTVAVCNVSLVSSFGVWLAAIVACYLQTRQSAERYSRD